jgi:DNA replication protein DnaC
MTAYPQKTIHGTCPKCRQPVDFEPCELLPGIVPLCDGCELRQAERWASGEKQRIWWRLLRARCPDGYVSAEPEKVASEYRASLGWQAKTHHGGLGLIGGSGSGKSCAVACVLKQLRRPFVWWSGTEARDAATDAATADRDREGARRKWEHAMTVPLLVLDDISQGRMTEAWSSKLFDLLETRLGGGLATLWTSQCSLADLRTKIVRQNGGDSDQAAAISRRLAQHSLILKS